MEIANFTRTIRPVLAFAYEGAGRRTAIELEIIWHDGRLSITGSVRGSAWGQIISNVEDALRDHMSTYPKGYSHRTLSKILAIWKVWHLNDMQAGSPAQTEFLRTLGDKEFPGYPVSHYEWASQKLAEAGLNPDPADGYKYGSAWRTVEVPADVVTFLRDLP